VTAAHVVHNAENVMVEFESGDKCLAKVQASSPQADLALLKLEKMPEGATPAMLGDSDRVNVGDDIFIIGAPYGIGHSLTVGYISARHHPNKVVKNFELGEFFQTDAAINTGNSGGPMFNMKGEVVGIVSNILTRSGGFEGVGFAVTSNTARKVLLEEPTPWSGVDFYMLSGDMARAFNIPQSSGALVMRVAVGSLGHKAGLKGGTIQAVLEDGPVLLGGDVVLAVQGIAISDKEGTIEKIRKAVSQVPVNGGIEIKVLRSGEILDIEVARE
jgi:S1-C subfamily serine protease